METVQVSRVHSTPKAGGRRVYAAPAAFSAPGTRREYTRSNAPSHHSLRDEIYLSSEHEGEYHNMRSFVMKFAEPNVK